MRYMLLFAFFVDRWAPACVSVVVVGGGVLSEEQRPFL